MCAKWAKEQVEWWAREQCSSGGVLKWSSQPQSIHLSDFGLDARLSHKVNNRPLALLRFLTRQTTGGAAKTSSSSSSSRSYRHRPGQQEWGLLNLNASRMLAGSSVARRGAPPPPATAPLPFPWAQQVFAFVTSTSALCLKLCAKLGTTTWLTDKWHYKAFHLATSPHFASPRKWQKKKTGARVGGKKLQHQQRLTAFLFRRQWAGFQRDLKRQWPFAMGYIWGSLGSRAGMRKSGLNPFSFICLAVCRNLNFQWAVQLARVMSERVSYGFGIVADFEVGFLFTSLGSRLLAKVELCSADAFTNRNFKFKCQHFVHSSRPLAVCT